VDQRANREVTQPNRVSTDLLRAREALVRDYCPWPLWGPGGNLDEGALPLSEGLRHRIRAWFNAYDKPRDDWPLWSPPRDCESAEAIEAAWVTEGEAIRSS
jgi:hypothetical protein